MAEAKRAFITGVNGFVGKYLTDLLLAQSYHVWGVDRWDTCPFEGIEYIQADILETSSLQQAISRVDPHEVYHLAAISYPPEADSTPRLSLEINIIGTVSLLDAVYRTCPATRVLLVGTSKQYNDRIVTDALVEETTSEPGSFYGISKYAGEIIGCQYARQFGLDIRFSRSFNHTGPGQPPRFVCSDWAKQASSIERGKSEPRITVGDTSAVIDFTDVRDVVRAYQRILTHGAKAEVYNVCSGTGISLDRILSYFIKKCTRPVSVQKLDTKLRAHLTNPKMIGSNAKLKAIGWVPEIPIEKTLDDLFDYWMKQQ
jgi:GDP-4-dehydro-6-deoxy-D-mannose reductase